LRSTSRGASRAKAGRRTTFPNAAKRDRVRRLPRRTVQSRMRLSGVTEVEGASGRTHREHFGLFGVGEGLVLFLTNYQPCFCTASWTSSRLAPTARPFFRAGPRCAQPNVDANERDTERDGPEGMDFMPAGFTTRMQPTLPNPGGSASLAHTAVRSTREPRRQRALAYTNGPIRLYSERQALLQRWNVRRPKCLAE
jgi:hypothetical protein